MDYLGEEGQESPSLNLIWGMCEGTENMLIACIDVCGRVSALKG